MVQRLGLQGLRVDKGLRRAAAWATPAKKKIKFGVCGFGFVIWDLGLGIRAWFGALSYKEPKTSKSS